MKAKDFFGKIVSPYLLGHLIAMIIVVVLLCLGVWHGLRIYTHHGEGIKVPDLSGMDYTKARELLEGDHLMVVVNDSGYNKRMPANCVLAQLPAAGMLVKEGRTVYLTINSLSSPKLAIPDLIDNSSFREAQARLQAMGFKMTDPKLVEGEKDWVYGIQCGARQLQSGDMVPIESRLTLVVGRGVFSEDEEVFYDDPLFDDSQTDGEQIDIPDNIVEE